jgi:RimJ/RimL family protein N-acetyltransferase
LTLEEEYENQQSWRTAHDKLTFIICRPQPAAGVSELDEVQKVPGLVEDLVGDVNFFLYPFEEVVEDDSIKDDENIQATTNHVCGEIDVMIAERSDRGQGFGLGAVQALLSYLFGHLDGVLQEYATSESLPKRPELRILMVKIKQDNVASIALFKKLGFVQDGEVNYFGEVKLNAKDLAQLRSSIPLNIVERQYVLKI